ncbi:MAG: elongation factor G [Candidatus Coatesbacteria bacterium]|nr:elongation factor G [Candidatus Coatesbacteria bacterium]
MKRKYPIESIRNIGIMAHIDAGKTTVTERILYYTGKTHRMGEVHDGTATMDFLDQERLRGITITSAATTCFWQEKQINIIDTPGHVDFTAEVERSLRVLDSAIAVLDGVNGVEAQTETVWYQAEKYAVPRLIFINKMDKMGADFKASVETIVSKLKGNPIICQIPIGEGENFTGVIDLLLNKAIYFERESLGASVVIKDIPENNRENVDLERAHLFEIIAQEDEDSLEEYSSTGYLTVETAKKVIRKLTIENKAQPVFLGSALQNIGIQPLLDAVIDYLPSPADLDSITGTDLEGKEVQRNLEDTDPLCAFCFKIVIDEHGKLAFFRIYSGTLSNGQKVRNPRQKLTYKIGNLFQLHAQKRIRIMQGYSGEIVAVTGIKQISTGDTITTEESQVILEPAVFPEPMVTRAIEPKTQVSEEQLKATLNVLMEEDPTFRTMTNQETGQLLIAGMGELHLEIITDRLINDFKVPANVGPPQVAYKESIESCGEAIEHFRKDIQGKWHQAKITVSVSPLLNKERLKIEKDISHESEAYSDAIFAGIDEAMAAGPLFGFPMFGVSVIASHAEVNLEESDDLAFKMASYYASKNAISKASPVLLEPVMKVIIQTPEAFVGEIIKDINAKRAIIENTLVKQEFQIIEALVPLRVMFGYATQVRSLSKGRASFSMEFHAYKPVPKQVLNELEEKWC